MVTHLRRGLDSEWWLESPTRKLEEGVREEQAQNAIAKSEGMVMQTLAFAPPHMEHQFPLQLRRQSEAMQGNRVLVPYPNLHVRLNPFLSLALETDDGWMDGWMRVMCVATT